MSAHNKTVTLATVTVHFTVALALPAAIVFGRGALGAALGLALIGLLVSVAAGQRFPLWPVPARAPLTLMAVVTVAWLPAIAGSLSPLVSATTLARSLALVGGGIVLTALLAEDKTSRSLRFFILGMLVAECFAVAALYLSPSLLAFRIHGVINPQLVLKASSSAIACALPVLAYGGWRLGGRWWILTLPCLVMGVAIMSGTGSKSSLAGVICAVATVALVATTRTLRVRYVLAVMAVAAGLAGIGLGATLKTTPHLSVGGYPLFAPTWLVDQHRQVIWQFTLERFLDRPWVGWGLNVINTAPGAGEEIPELHAEYIPSHPHNWMVETLAESGLSGFVPMLAVVVAVAVAAAAAYRRSGSATWLAWLALWLSYWSAGAFNFSMWNLSWQSSGAVLAVLLCARLPKPQ